MIEMGLLIIKEYLECVEGFVNWVRELLYIEVVIGGKCVEGVGFFFELMVLVGVM